MKDLVRTYLLPSYDPTGNLVRVFMVPLIIIFGYLAWMFADPTTRLDKLSVLESLLFAIIPMWAAWYAFRCLWIRKGTNFEDQLQPSNNARSMTMLFNRIVPRNFHYRMVFWISVGLFSWGFGNLWWLGAQKLSGNFFQSPALIYAYDAFYEMLQIGFLVGIHYLYCSQSRSLWRTLGQKKWTTIALVFGYTALGIALVSWARGWNLSHEEDPGFFIEQMVIFLIDGFVLATLFFLARADTLDTSKWTRSLRLGLTSLSVGWLIFFVADFAYEVAESLPEANLFRYYDGSFYDLLFIAAIVVMIHGLIFVVYAVLGDHPHLSFLSEQQRELSRLLVEGQTVKGIAKVYKRDDSTIERWITSLYASTGFAGNDRSSKRRDFVAYYRDQVEEYFNHREKSSAVYDESKNSI